MVRSELYCIPPDIEKQLQKAFVDYVNFPRKTVTISQEEMKKLRKDGGAKLVDIQSKAQAANVKWLLDLAILPQLTTHTALLTTLLGIQKGGLRGTDLFFISENYFVKLLKLTSGFYKKAIKAIIALHPRKKITNIDDEKVFYNPIFTAAKEGILRVNKI